MVNPKVQPLIKGRSVQFSLEKPTSIKTTDLQEELYEPGNRTSNLSAGASRLCVFDICLVLRANRLPG